MLFLTASLSLFMSKGAKISMLESKMLDVFDKAKINLISWERANEMIKSHDLRDQKHQDGVNKGKYFVYPDDNNERFCAIDNSTGNCWVEEFHNAEAAIAWLCGASLEDVQGAFPAEKAAASLQELRNEPIIGEVRIGGVRVVVDPGLTDVTYNEAVNYINKLEEHLDRRNEHLTELFLSPAQSERDITQDYTIKPISFQRIRRITGYLVGDLNRWNNAKKQEEHDRLKHTDSFGR